MNSYTAFRYYKFGILFFISSYFWSLVKSTFISVLIFYLVCVVNPVQNSELDQLVLRKALHFIYGRLEHTFILYRQFHDNSSCYKHGSLACLQFV